MRLYGNMIGNAVPRPDWEQTNSTAADFIKNKPDPLLKSGGTMSGAINMGSKKITNLATPTNNNDAVPKKYMEDHVASMRLSGTVPLPASWSSNEQTVTNGLSGIKSTDMPHWGIVYGTNKEAEKEAFALIDELETQDGKFIFRCFGDVPTVALTIQWEVNR